jgi:hypothetical protein
MKGVDSVSLRRWIEDEPAGRVRATSLRGGDVSEVRYWRELIVRAKGIAALLYLQNRDLHIRELHGVHPYSSVTHDARGGYLQILVHGVQSLGQAVTASRVAWLIESKCSPSSSFFFL